MGDPLPHATEAAGSEDRDAQALVERLTRLLTGAVDVWGSPTERRRLRVFGFRPAVEEGVLKREWHDLAVRAYPDRLVVTQRGGSTLSFAADDGVVRLDGEPFSPTPSGLAIAEALVGLIEGYERWVESREGRAERLKRARIPGPDLRPVNALAETRRIRRILTETRRAGR
jgi:hypothetical protein